MNVSLLFFLPFMDFYTQSMSNELLFPRISFSIPISLILAHHSSSRCLLTSLTHVTLRLEENQGSKYNSPDTGLPLKLIGLFLLLKKKKKKLFIAKIYLYFYLHVCVPHVYLHLNRTGEHFCVP